MSFWTAIVIIVAIVAFTEMMKSKHRARHGITQDRRGDEQLVQHEDPALKNEVKELRERIKVLERIATDGGDTKRLAEEIDKLRDN
jgi:hypothetical protein